MNNCSQQLRPVRSRFIYLEDAKKPNELIKFPMNQNQSYPQRVSERILPLSLATNLPEAFDEWQFTGSTEDHLEPCEVCGICGQEDLRYHFEIKNDFTRCTLDVASHCILRFSLRVYDNGEQLSSKDAKKYLGRLVQKMRLESCIQALENLAKSEDNKILHGALDYYKRNKKLTPKQAFVVFWRLSKYTIDYDPSFFSINLQKEKFVDDLRDMPTDRVHYFWLSLTSSQRKKAVELGQKPPST